MQHTCVGENIKTANSLMRQCMYPLLAINWRTSRICGIIWQNFLMVSLLSPSIMLPLSANSTSWKINDKIMHTISMVSRQSFIIQVTTIQIVIYIVNSVCLKTPYLTIVSRQKFVQCDKIGFVLRIIQKIQGEMRMCQK